MASFENLSKPVGESFEDKYPNFRLRWCLLSVIVLSKPYIVKHLLQVCIPSARHNPLI